MLWYCAPYSLRATARIVDVLPVPGGPYNRRWGNLFSLVSLSTIQQNKKMMNKVQYELRDDKINNNDVVKIRDHII